MKKERKTGFTDLSLATEFGKFSIVDASQSGVGTVSSVYIARSVTMLARVSKSGQILEEMESIVITVRWGRKEGDAFGHGFSIMGTPRQRERFFESIEYLESQAG